MDGYSLAIAGVIFTAISVVIAAATAIPTFDSWIQARRQRRVTKTPAEDLPTPASIDPAAASWRCGIHECLPFGHIEMTGETLVSGPLVDLTRQAMNAIGKNIEFARFTFEELYDGSPVPDVVLGMFDTPRRQKALRFCRPLYEIGLQGLCRSSQQGDMLDQMLEGRLKVAVYRGEIGWEYALDELHHARMAHNVIFVGGGDQMDTMTHLESGKYDVVIMDEVTCINFLREGNRATAFKMAFDQPLSTYKLSIAVRSDHADLIQSLDGLIEQIRNTPEFLDIEAAAINSFGTAIRRRGLRAPSSQSSKLP